MDISVFLQILILSLSSSMFESKIRLVSPCPHIFKYQHNGLATYGRITIPNPGPGPVKLEVIMSISGRFKKGRGVLFLRESEEDSKNDILSGRPVEYMLTFPKSKIDPYVTLIKLNDIVICRGSHKYEHDIIRIPHWFSYKENFITYNTTYGTKHTDMYGNNIITKGNNIITNSIDSVAQPLYNPRKVNFKSSRGCGISLVKQEKLTINISITGNTPVRPGEYPWLVALYHLNGNEKVPKCGGTLVSDTHVITAAHCVMSGKIYLELGLHEMKKSNEIGVVGRNVAKIHVHPDYINDTGIGDIAILQMDHPVKFTKKINPACIWPYNHGVYNERGYVAGWGANETHGDFTAVPTQTVVTIIKQKKCRERDAFKNITSDITFCAGGSLKGICVGDSGSGMYYPFNSIWYLRGVISTSISQDRGACSVDQNSVFADIAKVLRWIHMYIE